MKPAPVPGRLVLTLTEPAASRALLDGGQRLGQTGDDELDALNRSIRAVGFTALFPQSSIRKAKTDTGLDLSRYFCVQFSAQADLQKVRAAYEALNAVERAEFDWMQPLHRETGDSSAQWHLESRNGLDAHVTGGWNHSIGDSSIVLAIADSGVDWMHPDLGGTAPAFIDGNIWINWAEYHGTAGVDDDGNGLVDDIRGWDFVQSLGTDAWPGEDATGQDNDPRDFNGHGTHVAGIAGASTDNGIGVAGVGFRCKIMPLRIGGSIRDRDGVEQGVVFMTYAASAIVYASEMGATAINCSWGSTLFSPLAVAVDLAVQRGMAVVVAAGNDNNQTPSYLSSRGDCIDVAATTSNDTKAFFSNYGDWVDIAAPGVEIFSTYYDHTTGQHGYRALQGTSMAAPIITGLAGLIKAWDPEITLAGIETLLYRGADDLSESDPTFADLLGAGRVNALKSFGDRFLQVPGDYPTVAKALTASGAGDTVAVRGDTLLTNPLYVAFSRRVLLGGWRQGFGGRDLERPTIITSHTSTPCLEFAAGVDSTLILDGFRFSGGEGRVLSDPVGFFGGGVLCVGASPVFRHCRFDGNSAGNALDFGGGGGGFFDNSSARLSDCLFDGNQATQGAGLFAIRSSLRLEECRIEANSLYAVAGARGGGVYLDGADLHLQGGSISRNGLADDGGGLFARNATLELLQTRIERNASRSGGGMSLQEGSTLTMQGSLVRGNLATHLGGGIFASVSGAQILNVTFYENSGTGGCLFVGNAPTPWFLHNDLFVGHENVALYLFGTPVNLDYNLYWDNPGGDVQGASPGAHDLMEDPLFVDPQRNDLALGIHSPALDSGDPAISDVDGSPSDRGAFGGPWGKSRAPGVPFLQAARLIDGTTHVAWESDSGVPLALYALYRSADSTFVPSATNVIALVPPERTAFADTSGSSGDWYRLAAVDTSGASSGFSAAVPSVRTDLPLPQGEFLEPRSGLPSRPAIMTLRRIWPTPASLGTRIEFDLPSRAPVQLQIFDVRGRALRTLVHDVRGPGTFVLEWDGRDDAGRALPTGMYLVRLKSNGDSATRKLALLH